MSTSAVFQSRAPGPGFGPAPAMVSELLWGRWRLILFQVLRRIWELPSGRVILWLEESSSDEFEPVD